MGQMQTGMTKKAVTQFRDSLGVVLLFHEHYMVAMNLTKPDTPFCII